MINKKQKISISWKILTLIYCYLLSACNSNEHPKSSSSVIAKESTGSMIDEKIIQAPITHFLDTMPAIQQVIVPSAGQSSYNINGKLIVLSPPSKSKSILEGRSHFTTYSTDDGLALSSICSALLDSKGNIWFGTQGGGVSRYDGKQFTNFTTIHGLTNNTILCILEDKQGNMWFGTDGGGVNKYDGKIFTSLTTNDGLAGNAIRAMVEDRQGNIWFGSQGGGLSKLIVNEPSVSETKNKNRFIRYGIEDGLGNDEIWSLAKDKFDNLWIGTFKSGLYFFDHSLNKLNEKTLKKDLSYFYNINETKGLLNPRIFSLQFDHQDNLWIGTENGLFKMKSQIRSLNDTIKFQSTSNFFAYLNDNKQSNQSIRCMSLDLHDQLWVSIEGMGVCNLDPTVTNPLFKHYNTQNGLANDVIYSLTNDQQGNMWFGTIGGGVSKFNGNAFSYFTKNEGLTSNVVWSIEADQNGDLWFGTDDGGISHLVDKEQLVKNNNLSAPHFINYGIAQGLNDESILSLLQDKQGNLWAGTYGNGINKISHENGKLAISHITRKQGLGNNTVLSIVEDSFGDLWFATVGGGLSKLSTKDGRKCFTNYTTQQGLLSNAINFLIVDKKGNLWIGTQLNGISKLNIEQARNGHPKFINFTTKEGLSSDAIYCLGENTHGEIFVGTENGLNCLFDLHEPNHQNKYHIYQFTTANGLPDDFITNIVNLPNNKIGIGTNNGIAICEPNFTKDGSALLNNIELYNNKTGFPIKDINAGHHAMFLDQKGVLWAGTGFDKTGLVRLDYLGIQKSKEAPKPIIEKIKLNEQNICWLSTSQFKIKHAFDSLAVVQEQLNKLGKTMSVSELKQFRKTYEDIQFDSLDRFYSVPRGLVLPYAHNNISITFNAINVSRHHMINYQFKLEGYDKDWSPILKKTEVSYGNINDGNYVFKLKAQSPDGIWSEPLLLSFTVLPPWYRTWWAYFAYLLSGAILISLFIKWRLQESRERQANLEQTVKERTQELLNEKKEVERQKETAEKEFQRSEELLLNILPEEIAAELKLNGEVKAHSFSDVTVLFTDFVNFTGIGESLTPQQLVEEIHLCFTGIDRIIEKNGLEKIKTIGDAYLAVCGMPVADNEHALKAAKAALEIIEFVKLRKKEGGLFDIRIGLNSGSLVAGIVGVKKFAYDIWGDTVNTAARMEQNSEANKINISGSTYELIHQDYECLYRGKVAAKNKGEIDMYFLHRYLKT